MKRGETAAKLAKFNRQSDKKVAAVTCIRVDEPHFIVFNVNTKSSAVSTRVFWFTKASRLDR